MVEVPERSGASLWMRFLRGFEPHLPPITCRNGTVADSTAFVTRFRKDSTVRIRLPAPKFLNMKLIVENTFLRKNSEEERQKVIDDCKMIKKMLDDAREENSHILNNIS